MRCAPTRTASNLDLEAGAYPREARTDETEVIPMEKNRTEQVVCTTLLASSRPGVTLLTRTHGSVLVAPSAAFEGTAMSAPQGSAPGAHRYRTSSSPAPPRPRNPKPGIRGLFVVPHRLQPREIR